MSHLQAEYRTDKNGHVVLRHVRAEDSSGSPSRPLPAPKGSSPELTEQEVYERNKAVHALKLDIKDLVLDFGGGVFNRRRLMKTLLPETLPMLVDNGFTARAENQTGLPINLIRDCAIDNSFALINDFAAYLNDAGMDEEKPRMYSFAYLKGLYGGKPTTPFKETYGFAPYSEATPEEKKAQRAVISAAEQLGFGYIKRGQVPSSMAVVSLKSRALVEYIKANPDNVDAMVELIRERGIAPDESSLSAIDGLMNARDEITAPLMDGAL